MLDRRAAWRQLLMDSQARLRGTCGTRLLNLASAACRVGDHRRVIFSVVYMLARCLLGCLMVRGRREASKDAELLALRHENAVPSRQVGRVRYRPGDRLWLAALSRLIPHSGPGASLLPYSPGRPATRRATGCGGREAGSGTGADS